MKKYIAIVGDLVGSRSVSKRDELQLRFQEACDLATGMAKQSKTLVSPYTITLGDEFQAVLCGSEGLFCQLLAFYEEIYPVKVRIGLGLGTIDTKINRRNALKMDGPAFYRAREAIETLKKTDERIRIISDGDPTRFEWISAFGSLVWHSLESARNQSRLSILRGLLEGRTGREIATRLRLGENTVSEGIERGGLEPMVRGTKEAESAIDTALGA